MRRAADVCTGIRVLCAPLLAWQLAEPRIAAGWVPFAIYGLAAATDYLDGIVARAFDTASRRGRVFDHVADALLLFPAFLVLAARGRVPLALPAAATTAFAFYLFDGWRRGGSLAAIDLVGSRSGALGGVLNYVVAGAAAAAVAVDAPLFDSVIHAAGFAVAAVNAAAVLERSVSLVTSTRESLAAGRAPRASRS